MHKSTLVICLSLAILKADTPPVHIDPDQYKVLTDKMVEAAKKKNPEGVLMDGRRVLEVFPNDPDVQAPVYLLMADAHQAMGDTARAADYRALAALLHLEPAKGAAARGDASNTIQTAVSAITQSVSIIQQMQLMKLCLDMVKHNMAPPPQCTTPPVAQPMNQGFVPQPVAQPMNQGFVPQPIAPAPMAPMPVDPTAALQPFAPAPASAPAPMPIANAPVVYPPAPVGTAAYQPASTYTPPAPAPQQQQQQMQRRGYQQTGTQLSQAFAQNRIFTPYQTRTYQARYARTRSGDASVFRVVRDLSGIGSVNYFEPSCGALLSTSGDNLTLTTSCGDPIVIPANDILEMRVNSVVGREAGMFHVSTKKGLYLNLAPESGNREDARNSLDQIRKQLSLPE